MEAVGLLAGGVAHDFNNQLTVICGYAEVLLSNLDSQDANRSFVEEISKAGRRAEILTRQLLTFSRKQVVQPRVLDLNEVIEGARKMLGRLIGEDVEMIVTPDTALGQIRADPGQIEQVLMNLAVNARDAMPRGGKLAIRTENVVLDETAARLHAEIPPGRYVLLKVSDTGSGMTPEVLQRIFEPFFTTKDVGKGTGLGLATVLSIVKQSHGSIEVDSTPGRGTAFRFYWPCVEGPGTHRTPAEMLSPPRRGAETVLVVEDDASIQFLAKSVLSEHGYKVLSASSGSEALMLVSQYPDPIHLLLSDVIMPTMSGRVLAQDLISRRPEIRVLFMSGYTGNKLDQHGIAADRIPFLQKPFLPGKLLAKVREVLDAGKEGSR
jgi:CheY-like chemotaxis protein